MHTRATHQDSIAHAPRWWRLALPSLGAFICGLALLACGGGGDAQRETSSVRQDSILAAIVTTPRSAVFEDVGASARLEVRGLYSDGAERPLPDESGLPLTFRSSDPNVAAVDAAGLITARVPGGAEVIVEYGDIRARVPVLVSSRFSGVPEFDPQRVVEIAPGTRIVVNRVIIEPAAATYDVSLAFAIASDYGATVIAEWRNLGAALLEFDITTLDELETIVQRLDADPRVAVAGLDFIFPPRGLDSGRNASFRALSPRREMPMPRRRFTGPA